MSEEWRPIVEFPDYAVSSLGRVQRLIPDRHGRISHRPLKPILRHDGYFAVTLYRETRQRSRLIHGVVCEAFHGPRPDPGHHAAHRDGDKANNRADNLRWATVSENNLDKHYHGTMLVGDRHHARAKPETMPRGETHGNAKLTEAKVVAIRSDTRSQSKIAADYGISPSLVCMVRNRQIWAHVA